MENAKVTRHWGVAAIIIAVVVIVAGAALTLTTACNAKASQPPQSRDVIIQWQPNSLPETNLRARILADNAIIKDGLQAIADDREDALTPGHMPGFFQNTYFRIPKLWTDQGSFEGWGPILEELKRLTPHTDPNIKYIAVITSTSAVIEYQPHPGPHGHAIVPEKDVDGHASIKFTFSFIASGATKGVDPTGGGDLKHSRLCDWY
jgi:hypothetical protein